MNVEKLKFFKLNDTSTITNICNRSCACFDIYANLIEGETYNIIKQSLKIYQANIFDINKRNTLYSLIIVKEC